MLVLVWLSFWQYDGNKVVHLDSHVELKRPFFKSSTAHQGLGLGLGLGLIC